MSASYLENSCGSQPKPGSTGAVCLMTASTMQGMARARSGQARPGPWFLTGVSAEAPGSSVTLRVHSPGTYNLCSSSCGQSHA